MGAISGKIVWDKIITYLSKPGKSEQKAMVSGALLKILMPENTMVLYSEECGTKSHIAIKI